MSEADTERSEICTSDLNENSFLVCKSQSNGISDAVSEAVDSKTDSAKECCVRSPLSVVQDPLVEILPCVQETERDANVKQNHLLEVEDEESLGPSVVKHQLIDLGSYSSGSGCVPLCITRERHQDSLLHAAARIHLLSRAASFICPQAFLPTFEDQGCLGNVFSGSFGCLVDVGGLLGHVSVEGQIAEKVDL
ncbi:hypothetical protein Ancab_006525 [Ancistrocladus abbreviatus]